MKSRTTTRSVLFRALGYLVLIVVAIAYIYPFLIQLGTSFKTNADATANPLDPIPESWTVDAFTQLADQDFGLWATNSVVVATTVTLGRVFFDPH